MKLGKSFGLPVPDVDLLNIAEKDIFVVERYDRIKEADSIQRLHQEDFCQALCIMSTSKYQNDGGPGIADIFNTILKVCTKEDFFLLAESLNIKHSVLSKIFDDFAKNYIKAFEELKNDEKISRDILNSILQVVKSRF